MTVSSDLQSTAKQRLCYLRIDGWPYCLAQHTDKALPSNYALSFLHGLRIGQEASTGLNLREMTTEMSAMTFHIANIYDMDLDRVADVGRSGGTYYWSDQFAPGKWDASGSLKTWVARPEEDTSVDTLAAGATKIYTDSPDLAAAGWPSYGTAYIGREAFTYGGLKVYNASQSYFNYTSKGIYPCVDRQSKTAATSYYGFSYYIPDETTLERNQSVLISNKRFNWIGVRVALYVTTWDDEADEWRGEGEAQLLWCGEISDEITYSQERGEFSLTCRSILSTLDQSLGDNLPTYELGKWINLSGDHGRDFQVIEDKDTGAGFSKVGNMQVVIPAGFYTADELIDEIVEQAGTTSYTAGFSGRLWAQKQLVPATKDMPENSIRLGAFASVTGLRWHITPWGPFSHALNAAGLPQSFTLSLTADSSDYTEYTPHTSYHPLSGLCNGLKMRVVKPDAAAAYVDQGDQPSGRAYYAIRGGVLPQSSTVGATSKYTYVASATAETAVGDDLANEVDLALGPGENSHPYDGFVATVEGENLSVEGMYVIDNRSSVSGFSFTPFGPFAHLLFPLLSSGDPGYNGLIGGSGFDRMHPSLSLGIQQSLVDAESFMGLDYRVSADFPTLTTRDRYLIKRGTSWLDLLRRECKLFGAALVWTSDTTNGSRLALRKVTDFSVANASVTIDDGDTVEPGENWEIRQSTDNVVNSWEVIASYSHSEDKPGPALNFIDQVSRDYIRESRSVRLEHPGLTGSLAAYWYKDLPYPTPETADELRIAFDDFRFLFRFPWWQVDRSLAAEFLNRVHIGDVVQYAAANNFPDPFGGGGMSVTSGYALVKNVSWDYETFEGSIALLVNSTYDPTKRQPWASGALINTGGSHNTGGAPYYIELRSHALSNVEDSEDGETFVAGDEVILVQSDSSDRTAAQSLGPYTVSGYSTANQRLTFSGTPSFTGFSTTREYRVVPADWTDLHSQQTTNVTHQASTSTRVLGTSDDPQRWG